MRQLLDYFSQARRLGRRIAVLCQTCRKAPADVHLVLKNLDVCGGCWAKVDASGSCDDWKEEAMRCGRVSPGGAHACELEPGHKGQHGWEWPVDARLSNAVGLGLGLLVFGWYLWG